MSVRYHQSISLLSHLSFTGVGFQPQSQMSLGSFEFNRDIIDSFAKDLSIREALAANPAFKNMPAIVSSKSAIVEEAGKLANSDDDACASALERFSSFINLTNSLRETHSQFRRQTLLSLLVASRGFKATDPRDKLFALLNLAADKNFQIQTTTGRQNGHIGDSLVYSYDKARLLRCLRALDFKIPLCQNTLGSLTGGTCLGSGTCRRIPASKLGSTRARILETDNGGLIIPATKIDFVKLVCPFAIEEAWTHPQVVKDDQRRHEFNTPRAAGETRVSIPYRGRFAFAAFLRLHRRSAKEQTRERHSKP